MNLFEKGIIDAAAERSRATMWDVCRFAEYHSYNIIIVENVVDARGWIMWDAWIKAMHLLGYEHECVFRNSMHFHPTPQSRDRMYVVFWKKGNRKPNLNYTPIAYCPSCGNDVHAVQSWKDAQRPYGKYRTQYLYRCPKHATVVEPYYYAAFNCIDWSDPGTRIGDRLKPLSPNTERRIKAGLKKFSSDPFIIHAAYGKEARGTERHISSSLFTQTTFTSQAVVQPPFIIKCEYAQQDGYVKSSLDVLQTQATRQTMGLVTLPSTNFSTPSTTGEILRGIISKQSYNHFLSYYNSGSDQVSHITEAAGAIPTGERLSLVNYNLPRYEDCLYRMLKANEVKLGMAFDKDYIILGDGKEQVKQCGNAVTPPVMQWLVEQSAESLN
jgi:DNA (cytosine-5)-methyltransferase 1